MLYWHCRKAKHIWILKKSKTGQRRQWDNGRKKVQECDCAEPGSDFFLFSLWSIHRWTLWHFICCAEETSPCLNWSGFVSSLFSHDPVLYGSVRVGWVGTPGVRGIGRIAICLLRSHWEDVRLKLFYAWLTSLLHSSASRILLSALPLDNFSLISPF